MYSEGFRCYTTQGFKQYVVRDGKCVKVRGAMPNDEDLIGVVIIVFLFLCSLCSPSSGSVFFFILIAQPRH